MKNKKSPARAKAWDSESFCSYRCLLTVRIHVVVVLLVITRGYVVHPFLIIEIPLYGFLDTLLKLQRWLPTQFLLQLSRVNGVTHIMTLSVCYISNEVHILAFLSAEQKEKVRYSFQYPYFRYFLSLSSYQSARASSKLHLN